MPKLFDSKYPNCFIEVDHINGYLIPGPDIYVMKRKESFFNVPPMKFGSMPRDGGNFLLTPEEKDELIKKILAQKNGFVRLPEHWNLFVARKDFVCGLKVFRPMNFAKCLWFMSALKKFATSDCKVKT